MSASTSNFSLLPDCAIIFLAECSTSTWEGLKGEHNVVAWERPPLSCRKTIGSIMLSCRLLA